jgi:hypothetical protein
MATIFELETRNILHHWHRNLSLKRMASRLEAAGYAAVSGIVDAISHEIGQYCDPSYTPLA